MLVCAFQSLQNMLRMNTSDHWMIRICACTEIQDIQLCEKTRVSGWHDHYPIQWQIPLVFHLPGILTYIRLRESAGASSLLWTIGTRQCFLMDFPFNSPMIVQNQRETNFPCEFPHSGCPATPLAQTSAHCLRSVDIHLRIWRWEAVKNGCGEQKWMLSTKDWWYDLSGKSKHPPFLMALW